MKLYLEPLPKIRKHSMPQSEVYFIYSSNTNDRPYKQYVLNETGLEIIQLYNGSRTHTEIINYLSKKYNDSFICVEIKVNEFLNQLSQYGYKIKQQELPIPYDIVVEEYQNLYPSVVSVEITEKCNLLCKHCYGEYEASNEKEMNLKDVDFLLASLKEIGIQTIEVTGGEPSIHPDAPLILEKIDEIGIPTVMFLTNGVYLNEELLKLMISIKDKLFVQVSLHTLDSEYYNWFTGTKNKLNIVKENIKKLVSNGIKVRITAMITSQNIDEMIEIGNWAFKNGAKLYAPSTIIPLGRANDIDSSNNLYLKDIKEQQAFLSSINKINAKYPNFILEASPPGINCGALTTQGSISASGDLKLCTMDNKEYFDLSLGNVLQESVKTIYDRHIDFFSSLRILKAPTQDCDNCYDCEERFFCSNCILRGFIGSQRAERECGWYKEIEPILKKYFV